MRRTLKAGAGGRVISCNCLPPVAAAPRELGMGWWEVWGVVGDEVVNKKPASGESVVAL